jgi:hypothetical protein
MLVGNAGVALMYVEFEDSVRYHTNDVIGSCGLIKLHTMQATEHVLSGVTKKVDLPCQV